MGHCSRCSAGVVCIFGIVEMFVCWLGFIHVPRPAMGMANVLSTPSLGLAIASSLLIPVPLLFVGECGSMDNILACWLTNPVCNRPSMRLSLSRMSLSPASSLTPGSRYTQSAFSSVHSLHLGLAPSHLDFRPRHISHYFDVLVSCV